MTMNKLDKVQLAYKNLVEARKVATCLSDNNVAIGPSAKGTIYFTYKGKDITQNITINELIVIRNLINKFLHDVVGEDNE